MTQKDTQPIMPDFGTEARNLANLWTNGNDGARTCILAALERAYKAGGIDTTGALLLAIADIRDIPGIGGNPMLSELGATVLALLADKDAQIAKLSFRLNTPRVVGRPASTIEELILQHVTKTGSCIYAKLAAALKHRVQKPELMEKLDELAAAGKLFLTHDVKRYKGRPATVVSIRPFNASTIHYAPKSTPNASCRNSAFKRVATERIVRLAIRDLGGKGTIHQIIDETECPDHQVYEVLDGMILSDLVRTKEIDGDTYYRITRFYSKKSLTQNTGISQ